MKIDAEQVLCRFHVLNFSVEASLPVVDELVTEGLVTLEAVRLVRYVSPESR